TVWRSCPTGRRSKPCAPTRGGRRPGASLTSRVEPGPARPSWAPPSKGRPSPRWPTRSAGSAPLSHPGIRPEKDEHEVHRGLDAVSDDRYGETAPAVEVEDAEQQPHQPLVEDTCQALVGVRETEPYVHREQTDNPCRAGTIHEIGHPVHQVAAVDHL